MMTEPTATDRQPKGNGRQIALLLVLVAIGITFRIWLLQLPSYRYVFYDEAIPGLMALDILDGKWPLVYWAHPYLGSLDAIAAAGLFAVLEPSTLVLRLSVLCFFALFAVLEFKLAQEVIGQRFPWYVLVYLCLPPLGLNEFSLSTIGGYIHTVAIGTLLLLITTRALKAASKRETLWTFAWLGFFSGLGFWTFLMILPFLAACYGTLFLKLRRELFRLPLLVSAAAFFVGSLPLWVWNLGHDFLGFKTRVGSAAAGSLLSNVSNFFKLLYVVCGRTDEYAVSPLRVPVTWAITAVLLVVLAYLLRYHLVGLVKSAIYRRVDPGGVELVIICFAISALAYIFSNKGSLVLVRYGMPLYATLPILMGLCFHRLARGRRWLHVVFAVLLLAMNLPYNVSYTRQNLNNPQGDDIVDLIDFCRRQGLHHAYGHYTVAHPITFESRREVMASDFGGFRNSDYLKAVDRSDRVAIITDTTIPYPHPETLAQQLDLVTDGYQRRTIGKYVVFYDFKMSRHTLTDVSDRIKTVATTPQPSTAERVLDRVISTYWHSHRRQSPEDQMIIELDTPRPITRITLLPGFQIADFPRSLEVALSSDGSNWKVVKSATDVVEAFIQFGNKPRLFGSGQLDIALPGEPARFIRLRPARPAGAAWTIAELFLFENAGPRPSLDRRNLETIVRRHPDAFIYTTPWINTHLEAITGVGDRLLTLYPEDLIYREVYRYWDFERHRVDFSHPNLFVIYPEDLSAVTDFLKRLGLPFRTDDFGPLAAVRTEAMRFAGLEPVPSDANDHGWLPAAPGMLPPQWRHRLEGWHGLRWHNRSGVPIGGISLPQPDLRLAMGEVAVFTSDDQRNWKPVPLVNVDNAYWADGRLLGINTPDLRWYFQASVTDRYVTVWVRPDPDKGAIPRQPILLNAVAGDVPVHGVK